MSERDQSQSGELRALRQELTSLRQEIADLPPAVGAELATGLHPLAAVQPISAALLQSNQALFSELEAVRPEMQKLTWHLAQPVKVTFLGWSREEWSWLGAVGVVGAATAIVGVNLLIRWLT